MKSRKTAFFFENLLFVACVFGLLAAPVLFMDRQGTVSMSEKRKLAPWPDPAAWRRVDPRLGREIEDWLNDRFFGRNILLDGQAHLDCFLNGAAANDDMFTGKDGWLFFKNGGSLDSYQNTDRFTRGERIRARNNLLRRARWLQAQGCALILLVAPAKNQVYSDMMPDGILCADGPSRAGQIAPYLREHADIPVVDVLEDIRAEKEAGRNWLYFQQDTHWTDAGAFIAYRKLMRQIQAQFPNVVPLKKSDFEWEFRPETGGDLSQLARVSHLDPESNVRYEMLSPSRKLPYEIFSVPDSDEIHTVCEDRPLKVMVFRDSFGEAMIPFLSSTFGEVRYISSHHINIYQDEILAYQPDLIIHEIAERLIPALLSDQPPLRRLPDHAF